MRFFSLAVPLPGSVGIENMQSIINAKKVTKLWKRKIKTSPPVIVDKRDTSNLVGVFSAINISKKWKNKINKKRVDEESIKRI